MNKIIFIACITLLSCHTAKKITTSNNEMNVSKTQCGSYEIKKGNTVLGYVVQPFYIKFPDMEQGIKNEVSVLETLLSEKYSTYYDNSLRVYYFTINRSKDTIIDVLMLTKKQADLISNWQCEFLDVDQYKTKHRHKSSKEYPDTFVFNCSKKRFKDVNDPD